MINTLVTEITRLAIATAPKSVSNQYTKATIKLSCEINLQNDAAHCKHISNKYMVSHNDMQIHI